MVKRLSHIKFIEKHVLSFTRFEYDWFESSKGSNSADSNFAVRSNSSFSFITSSESDSGAGSG